MLFVPPSEACAVVEGVGTPALLAALVTVWLPGVAVAAAEWSGPGAGVVTCNGWLVAWWLVMGSVQDGVDNGWYVCRG